MKFLIFTDFHYYPGVTYKGTQEDLETILQHGKDENVDFIIHAGDLCPGPSEVAEFVKVYNDFEIPTYHCLGNHDTDITSYADTLKYYHMEDGHYYFDKEGYRFIICDPNYYLKDGEYIHFDLGNWYQNKATKDYMPPEQLTWLEEVIASSEYPCVLISHQSFERKGNGVKNQDEVQEIIRRANKRKAHSVILCINGHLHRDHIRILDNVCYLDLNSSSWDYVSKPHNHYPEEMCRISQKVNHTLLYCDPLHAIITLEGTTITIEGMESEMFMGINREHTENNVLDEDGRPCTPRIQSAKLTLG